MKVTQFKTVYQLALMANFFPVNCYLVEEEQGLTLIDAGLSFSLRGIVRAAAQIGKPITRIILTHAHADHVGALDGVKKAYPDAQVYISARDSRIMNHDLSLDHDEAQTPIKGGIPKSVQTRPDVLLYDGDQIGSLVAIASPGHTPGSMSFLDTRNQSLMAGDAFQVRGGIAVAGQIRPTFPFPAWGTWNKQLALVSAEKLVTLKPALLATGHGKMLPGPVRLMEQAIHEARKNLRC